jgi:hypothetical protein
MSGIESTIRLAHHSGVMQSLANIPERTGLPQINLFPSRPTGLLQPVLE